MTRTDAALPPFRMRLRHVTRGGHVHVRVFAGRAWDDDVSLGKSGDLIFALDEWPQVAKLLGRMTGVSVLPEDGEG